MNKKFIFILKYYLPVIIWMAVIFYFSSIPSLRYSENTTEEIILRKGAHFVEFAVLSWLFWRIFFKGHNFSLRRAFGWALALAVLYGFSDEWHQHFVMGRTGKIIDAFFDSISALLLLEFLITWVRKKINWKNIAVIIFSILALIGMELKMISDTKSPEFSFSEMKVKLYYSVKYYFNQIGGIEESNTDKTNSEQTDANKKTEKKDIVDEVDEIDLAKENNIPEQIFIKVPFAIQSPFAKWDELHEEACEEASLIMLKYYLDNKILDKNTTEKEIQNLVEFQIENYGDYKDTTAAETVKLAEDYYGIKNLEVIYDFKKEDLKKYLALGKPIIVPAAGRLLGNPYFTPPGPLYHNLVLTGYNGDAIITNDPGTKRGENYEYNIDILYNAIHDFTGRVEDIEGGRKAMIVVE